MMSSTPGSEGTLILSRSDIERHLPPHACIAAVEDAFRRHALGEVPDPAVLGFHAGDGGFHVKAGLLTLDRPWFAAKVNANFPQNGVRHGLPTIQGIVILSDASNGKPLALMDSMALTALRTAAATAVAARHLARERCDLALVCGCGAQAREQVRALLQVRSPEHIQVHDVDGGKASAFALALQGELRTRVTAVTDLAAAVAASDIVVTCTTASRYFITREMVRPGTFVAGVGADNEHKQELEPDLLAHATVVTDLTDQCGAIGDLHHAIVAGAMSASDVHAQLGEVVAGMKPGRRNDDEITVFDSTGTALQDVAAAAAAYARACEAGQSTRFAFAA
jgi:ornithine cyclodeaminase/alanine dehydrogenase-like protein (mu-crystallin family)